MNFEPSSPKIVLFLLTLVSCSPFLPIENPFEGVEEGSAASPPSASPLRILVLDVGQGDATLVLGPTGRSLLIDGGPVGSGITVVLPVLALQEIDRLQWILASHYDSDHIGGIAEILKGPDQLPETEDDLIPTLGVLDRGGSTDQTASSYEEYLETTAAYRQTVEPGQQLDLGGGTTAEVIVANGRYADGRRIHLNPDEENESSIGLLIQYGAFRYFTAGDLTGGGAPGGFETKDLETIAGEIIGDIDILHVGHHGSNSSTNAAFLDLTQPEVAVISVGRDNDYGHPTEGVLQRLEEAGTLVYRTDRMGTLEIRTNGDGFEILQGL